VAETRVAVSPATLATFGSRSCCVLSLYDPKPRIGGLLNLKTPADGSSFLEYYATMAVQRLLTEMRGVGASKGRLMAHIIAGDLISSSALRAIEDTLRCQGLKSISADISAEAGREIRFSLANGRVTLEESLPTKPRDIRQMVATLGSQLLDLHAFQETIETDEPALSLQRLLQQIAYNASQMLGGVQCFVALQEDGKRDLIIQAASSLFPQDQRRARLSGHRGIVNWAFARGEPLLINSTEDANSEAQGQSAVRSLIGVPLLHRGRPMGVLCAVHSAANAFAPEDLCVLQSFAHQVVVAVQNIQLYQQLQARAKEMEAILQGIGDGIIVTDPSLRLVMANPAARRLLHLEKEALPGDRLPEHHPLTSLLQETGQGASFIREIELGLREGGRKTICQVMVSRIADTDGSLRGMVAVLRDITAQRDMEKLKSNLLTVVSHELKTPLHSISGFVDIILMGKTGEVTELQRDFLRTVKQQTTQLQNIINDLLEFSRLEYGQIKLTTESLQLGDIARNVLHKFQLIAGEHEVVLTSTVPGDLPMIEGDSVRLEQVLTNLVDNALKFTPQGGQVTIGAADLGQEVEFWVSDTGIGIPPAEQPKVFERFYQVANGSSAKRHGAGLGLTICKHIVERHQGRIWVESAPGRGSTFHVALPKCLQKETALSLDFARLGADSPGREAANSPAPSLVPTVAV